MAGKRALKPLKREYDDESSSEEESEKDGKKKAKSEQVVMKMTKKISKKVKPTTDEGADDVPMRTKDIVEKIGFDIALGPVQNQALHDKYKAMTLDELKQYMKVRARV